MLEGRAVVLLRNDTVEFSRYAVFDEGQPVYIVYQMVRGKFSTDKRVEVAPWIIMGIMTADGDLFRELSNEIQRMECEEEVEMNATDHFGSAVGFF